MVEQIERTLSDRILGEEEAIQSLIHIAKKLKLGFARSQKSYSILFCGSTGVGKTCLARSFGELLVGKENVIKLDMSEYSESHSVSKLVGAPPGYVGYQDQKNVFEKSSCKLSFKHIFSIRNNTIKLYRCFSHPQQEAVFGTEPATYRIAF